MAKPENPNSPAKSSELPVVSLKAVSIGSLNQYSPTVDVGFNYSSKDTQYSRSTALNNLQQAPSKQVSTYMGIVALTETIPQSPKNMSWWLRWLPDEEMPKVQVLYVFIDVRHFDIIDILEPWNLRTLLTRVETGKSPGLGAGSIVELAVADGDFSKATLIDVKDDKSHAFQEMISKSTKAFFGNCDGPAATPKQPSPSSTPSYRSNNNVGYIQLAYALAQWQTALNKRVVVEKVTYPFGAATESGKIIGGMLGTFKDYNDGKLKDLSQLGNTDRTWLLVTNVLLKEKIKYAPGTGNPAAIVHITVDKKNALSNYINKFKIFHKGYSVMITESAGNKFTLSISFGASDDKPATSPADAVALTMNNFAKFQAKLNKEILPQPDRTAPDVGPPLLVPGECDSAGRVATFDSEVSGVDVVASPSLRPNRSCSKNRKIIVLHEPGMGNVTSKRIYDILDGRCLDGKAVRIKKKDDGDALYVTMPLATKGPGADAPKCPRPRQGLSVHFILSPNKTMQSLPMFIGDTPKCGIHAGGFNSHSVAVEFGVKSDGVYWDTIINNFAPAKQFERLYHLCYTIAQKLSQSNDDNTIKEFMKNPFFDGTRFFLGWAGYAGSPSPGLLPKGVVAHWRQATPAEKMGNKHWDALIPELYVQLRAFGKSPSEAYSRLLPVAKRIRSDVKSPSKRKTSFIDVNTTQVVT